MTALRITLMIMALIVLTAFVSHPAHADAYLCIGERYASVTYTQTEVVGSKAGTSSDKLLVDENGVRFFGRDNYVIERCDTDKGRPTICGDGANGWVLIMSPGLVFTFNGMTFVPPEGPTTIEDIEKSPTINYQIAGKCSRI